MSFPPESDDDERVTLIVGTGSSPQGSVRKYDAGRQPPVLITSRHEESTLMSSIVRRLRTVDWMMFFIAGAVFGTLVAWLLSFINR